RRTPEQRAVGRGLIEPLRNILVSRLRVRPPPGVRRGRRRRSDAGVLHARPREELLPRRRSRARPFPIVSVRRRAPLPVERTRSGTDPQARWAAAADFARRGARRRPLSARASRRSDAGEAVRSPLGTAAARARARAFAGGARGGRQIGALRGAE